MNILHVYKDYPPVLGGIENHLRSLAEAQAARGHQVTVLIAHPRLKSDRRRVNGVQLVRVSRWATLASMPVSPGFPRALASAPADITHLHHPFPLGEVSQWLAGGSRPYVITYHSDIVNPRQQALLQVYKPWLRRILGSAAAILATSPNYVRSSEFLQPLAGRCIIVPLGLDPAPFQQAAPLIESDGTPLVLFVGRHRYYKGVHNLLQAMVGLPGRLAIAGDGPLRPSWERLAAQLDLGERVRFLGDVPPADLPGLYASADVFVLPATMRAEAFGLVLLEAMAAGLPCVTTELGTGTTFVVRQERTGLVVPPDDPVQLARALYRLLSDRDLRVKMGAEGRARVVEAFKLDKMVRGVEAVYRKALAGAGRGPAEARAGLGKAR